MDVYIVLFPFCIAQEGNGFRLLMAVFAHSMQVCLPNITGAITKFILVTGYECVIC